MIRLLYAGAANLAQPGAGMDLGSRCHFEELSDDRELLVDAVSVSAAPVDPAVPPSRPARLFTAEVALPGARVGIGRKLALLARGGILFQTGFVSGPARAALRRSLATNPDILVVDHIAALANIPLLRLVALRLRGRTKIVVVSHDISSELLRDRARLQSSKLRAMAIRLHAMHCHLYETLVYALAHRVSFVSSYDRDNFSYVRRAKTDALCQIIELPPADEQSVASEMADPYLIFVGAPSFFPNGAAIEWIQTRLAPALQARMPELKIVLVGKGTDRPAPGRPANVLGLGFVDDERLHNLLRASRGALSPVVHGSGIKIKVLEAIAAGCAIFATEPSLRGYEFMRLDPVLDVADAERSADRVVATIDDPARLAAYHDQIRERWQQFKRVRRGRFAAFVKGTIGPATPLPALPTLDQPFAH